MKILHTSDWHLGRSLYDFSLLDDQSYMLERLLELLEHEDFDAVIIAGDVYDRPTPSAAAVRLYDSFLSRAVGELGITVLAVGGNHDSLSRLSFGGKLYAAVGYHICGHVGAKLHRVTLSDEYGPVHFWFIPFLHPAEVRALFPDEPARTYNDAYRVLLGQNRERLDENARNVAIAHGFFADLGGAPPLISDSEASVGGMDIADSALFSAFDYVALGHLHAPQRAGCETVRYSGSPLKYSLSEERQPKSFTEVELGPKGEVTVAARPVCALRDLRTVEGPLNLLLDPSHHADKHFDDYVFASLTDTGAMYPMEKLRTLFPKLLGLRLCGAEGQIHQVEIGGGTPKLSPREMFLRFYRDVKGQDMPRDELDFLTDAIARREAGMQEEWQ